MMRQSWIDKGDTVALTWQCALAGVSRASVYARQKPKLIAEDDEVLKRLIDQEYTSHPFYGSRKMVVYLGHCAHIVNRKRAQRLMRTLGLQGMAPGPNTSRAHPQHKVPPYATMGELLMGLTKYFVFYNAERPHQALKHQTPDVVHKTATGGGAMILDKYSAAEGLPIALRSTGTALNEVGLEKSAIPNATYRGSAVQLCVKSSAT